eukprot:6172808-Pleurochrysis_carterae.AAC.1
MHVLSSSELGLEVTITAIVRPAMGSQNKQKPATIEEPANTYKAGQIKTHASDCACVCSGSTPWAQKRPLACLRKGSRRATRRVLCSALSQPSLRQ